MHRSTVPRFPVVSPGTVAFLVFLFAAAAPAVTAGDRGDTDNATRVAQQVQTRFLYFGMAPGATYRVQTDEGTFDRTTSPDPRGGGVVDFTDAATVGESIILTNTGVAEVFPSDPTGFAVTDEGANCARFSWDSPDPGEYVTDYEVRYGSDPGDYTNTLDIGNTEWTRPGATSYSIRCGIPEGTWYFALRAHNAFDHWSGLSNEVEAGITGEQTQPPEPPNAVTATEDTPGCATVSWEASGSPGVTGYTVYRGEQSGVYTDSTEVTGSTSAEICDLAAGRWYFALRTLAGTERSALSDEASLDVAGPDTTPPVFSQLQPADGSTDVARNTQVFFTVADAGTGVDRNTIAVTINGSDAGITTLGSSEQYMVVAGLQDPLPAEATITVVASALDLADPANEASVTWEFVTSDQVAVDTTPPSFSALSPADGATNVDPDKPVRVTVSDAGAGLDLASIALYVNDTAESFSLSGDIYSATITYSGDLSVGSTVTVRVEACDMAAPSNCAVLDEYSFTVAGAAFTSLPDGAIVPDGFWANEPERPLEIRNLPSDWTVRIFDAAGTPVRVHHNNGADGETWLWDFNNDHGRRVARAIYLVRVSDANGDVQRSGRFLVQVDP